jgi:hypothetical protein
MLKNIIKFEMQVAGKVYHFLCDNDSTLNDIKLSIFELSKIVAQVEEGMKAAQEQAKAQEQATPDISPAPVEEQKPAE